MRNLLAFAVPVSVAVLASCTWLNSNLSPEASRRCDEAEYDSLGHVIVPPGVDTTQVVVEQGPLAAAHPGFDTSTDEWYSAWLEEDCPVLGGYEPDNDAEEVPDAAQDIAAANQLAQLETALNQLPPPATPYALPPVPVAPADSMCGSVPCASLVPAGSPFHGADIIYVHGLLTKPLGEVLLGGQAKPAWPVDGADFLQPNGYWRQQAIAYWATHVSELLDTRNAKNRVLFVGWSPLQPLQYAAHTLLAQVSGAMLSGKGVILRDPTDPRGSKGFCQPSCVIVSHSAGGLVTDVAMALAAHPSLAPPSSSFATAFQGVSWIPGRMRVHVALGTPFSGNQYASAAIAVGAGLVPLSSPLCGAGAVLLSTSPATCPAFPMLMGSVVRDLSPERVFSMWRPMVAATPVPVLTIAGGHEDRNWPVKRFFAAGFDDGVVNMDSGCGRSVAPSAWPTGYFPSAWRKVFDLGIPKARAVRYFSEQRFEPTWSAIPFSRASAACSPWKSPTGMVQPVQGYVQPPMSPFSFIANHHPFVQTAESHSSGLRDCHERPAEDVLVIANHQTYSWVSTGIAGLQEETVKKKPLTSKRTLWKRTYHQLQGWQGPCAADYAYDWVL